MQKDKDKPVINIFLTLDRCKNCGEVKLVLLYPNPLPMCGQWLKNKNTNRLTVKIKLEKCPIHQDEYLYMMHMKHEDNRHGYCPNKCSQLLTAS